MNDQQILASPNWYHSAISDISVDGVFAYGGKNTIFLLDLTNCCQYIGQLCGHKDRLTSLNFCRSSPYSRCCVSCSEDQSVVIWDIDSKEAVLKHNRHQTKINAVYWSQASHGWIYSGDEKGHILSWNHQENEVYEHVPINGHIDCISCPPDEENIVAVGYKTGQIIILLLLKERHKILYVLKGHSNEIHSLVWSPVAVTELPSEIFGVPRRHNTGHILASGSRDKTIRLWDVSSGQFIALLHVPDKSSNKKASRDEHHMKSRLWNTLCWPHPDSFISSAFNGDILSWSLSTTSKQKWQLFDEGKHSRIVFNIVHYAANDVIVSVSMDRLINIWSIRDATLVTSLPTCGGFIYSLDISVLDPSRLAVGVGDGMIRVWDAMKRGSSCGVSNLWRGVGAKIMKVLWHPVKEGLLAFGTEEGKVGIYNIMSQTCAASRTYHQKSVYSLSWGPPTGSFDGEDESDKIWHLYSCGGEGMILAHKPENLHDEAKNLNELIKTTNNIKHNLAAHSEVAWKPDRSLMAVGGDDGSIRFYRFPDLKLLSTINVHNKSVTCLVWYRTNDADDSSSMFLASGSNGSEVHVHNLKDIIDVVNVNGDKVITCSYRWLTGHSGRVTNLAWSPHSSAKLASSSYDGTVQVWDVAKGEPLVNYRGHSGRVMTVTWSLLDPDVLFSGSDDFTVRSWRISQQLFKEPPIQEAKKLPKSKKKKNKKTTGDNSKAKVEDVEPGISSLHEKQSVENDSVHDEKEKVMPAKANGTENVFQENHLEFLNSVREENKDTPDDENVVRLSEGTSTQAKAYSKKKKKKGKSLFPLSANADNKPRSDTSQECVQIAEFWAKDTDYFKGVSSITESNVNLGLYLDRKSAFDMFTEEGNHHTASGNMDFQLQLEIWKGNIGKALELAVEKRQITDWLVAVSHLAGENVRLVVTEAFAEQLVSQGSYQRAAMYFLACHKVYEAIHVLRTADMFREAVSLAKVRLLPSDPLLLDLFSSWGRKLETEQNFELASKCYLSCGLHDDAIRVLTRRADELSFHTAAQVAKLYKKINLSQTLILQCAVMATKKARWNDALEMVHDYPDMQPFLMLMFVHKTVLTSLLKSGAVTLEDFPELQPTADNENINANNPLLQLPDFLVKFKAQYERRSISDSKSSATGDDAVYTILETWWSHCGLLAHETRLPGFYVQISALQCGNQSLSNKQDIMNIVMFISKNVCLGLAAVLLGKPDFCMEHFMTAIVHCHDLECYSILWHLVDLLFPFRLESWHLIQCLAESYRESASNMIDQYFCNIMAFYYRSMLTESLIRLKLKHDSQQDCSTEEITECVSLNTIKPCDKLLKKYHGTKVNQEQSSESAGLLQSSGCPLEGSNLDKLLRDTSDLAEKLNETEFKEMYRLVLVCSTVLLSDIYVKIQKPERRSNIKENGGEETQNDSKSELEISLSKIPYPNVMESALMLVDLLVLFISSQEIQENDKALAVELSRQIAAWAMARECGEDKSNLFKKCLRESEKHES